MADQAEATRSNALYERDLYEWTQQQARLLQERRFADLDLDNLVEEVRSVGGSEKREIENRLKVLIMHLLKWKYQPGRRSTGWSGTIDEQRSRLARVLAASPSLSTYPAEVFELSYLSGRLKAAKETGIDFTLFPEQPPFSIEQVLDPEFLPKEPDLYDQS